MATKAFDISKELQDVINVIAATPGYHGRPTSPSIMKLIQIEKRVHGSGIVAPPWLGVLERGRGKRTSTTNSDLWRKMYAWMQKNNLFKSRTERGMINEAKSMTWWINKYGNKQFRSKVFIDVYSSAVDRCVVAVEKKYGDMVAKITSDIL